MAFTGTWCNETVLLFLKCYEKEPVLWKPSHPHYKDMYKIHQVWKRIESKLEGNFPIADLRKKRNHLLSTFRYNNKKIAESKIKSTKIDQIYKPVWFAYEKMSSFLNGKGQLMETIKSETPILEFVDLDELHEQSIKNESSSTPAFSDVVDSGDNHEVLTDSVESPEVTMFVDSRDIIPVKGKKKIACKRKQSQEINEPRKRTEQLSSPASTSLRNDDDKDEDECDLYGKFIAKKLKKLPASQREQLMYEIQGVFLKFSRLS